MSFDRRYATAVAAILLSLAAARAEAGVVRYDLVDTPHAGFLTGGFYEHVGGNPRYNTYSFERDGFGATLTYDDAAQTVRIAGKGYDLITGKTASFGLFYDDLTRDGEKLTLGDMGVVGAFGGTAVRGKGFDLTFGETLTGHGWLTDPTTGRHFGDFHFAGREVTPRAPAGTAGAVPAPAPLGLLAMGALFGFVRRRRG